MAETVNIDLITPAPIVFSLGAQDLKCSALITAQDAFVLRRLMTSVGESMEAGDDAAFTTAATELHDHLVQLFKEYQPKLESLPLSLDGLLRVATTLWQRGLGATDDYLKEQAEEGNPPPNRATRRKRSTSQPGSAASQKPTATRPRTGSASR